MTEDIRLDLLELYGSGYVIDHCISALSRRREKTEEKLEFMRCITYFADCLKVITENTANAVVNGEGTYIVKHLSEILKPDNWREPEMSPDEIAADIIKRAGLSVMSMPKEGS